jgi:predicted dehydrogenase
VTLRVGVVGGGAHARTSILPNLAAAGFTLGAVCTRHLDAAQSVASMFGAPEAFDDAAKMLAVCELDALVVVVPPEEYGSIVALALDAGLPVFVEKPGAASAGEASHLAARADAAGVPIVVGYQKRFAVAYAQAMKILRAPEFGPVTAASFTWSMGPMTADLRAWVLENPVHHIDLARFLVGELDELHVVRGTAGTGHALLVSGRTAAGAPVSLHINTTGSWHQRNEHVEVFGQGHAVTVDNVDTCTWRTPERPEQVWRPNYTVPLPHNASAAAMGFAGGLRHFADIVRGASTEPVSDLRSAARTLELAERIAAAA